MKKALLVIDVQNGMFQEGDAIYQGKELLKKLDKIIHQARINQMPIFYIQHNEPAGH